jgi:hypothetical protein
MNNVELAIKRLTPYGDYGDDGHTQSRFDLALDDENADGAYPPYLGTFVAGKFSVRSSNADTADLQRRMLKNCETNPT